MSGHYKGLQSRILRQNPKALYVHCQAHSLNLVLVESAKSNFTLLRLIKTALCIYWNAEEEAHQSVPNGAEETVRYSVGL